jgi:hypothetical protein
MATQNKIIAAKSLESIFNDRQYDITAAKKSQSWFSNQVKGLSSVTPNKLLNSANFVSTLTPGEMYLFFYDPKHKATLPYYDRFPLILPFRKVKGGFYGLNFHYLPPLLRVRLLDRLLMFSNTKGITEDTRLKFKYQMIAGSAKFGWAQPCVKMYLNDHVRSRFAKIEPEHWVTAMMLPVERFAKQTKETVWRESRKSF